MSCPFSALELRDLISKLEVLERWQRREEVKGHKLLTEAEK